MSLQVYETLETILAHPEENIVVTEQPDETSSGESKSRFKKINMNFVRREKQPSQKKAPQDDNKLDERNAHRILSTN